MTRTGGPMHDPPGCQQPPGATPRQGLGCRGSGAGRGEGPSGGCWKAGEGGGREFSSSRVRSGKAGSFSYKSSRFSFVKKE